MTDMLALAAVHGCQPPTYRQEDRPELFQCWADRVQLVASMQGKGEDAGEMVRKADIYAGNRVAARPMGAVAIRLPRLAAE